MHKTFQSLYKFRITVSNFAYLLTFRTENNKITKQNIGKFTGTAPNLIFECFWQLENHRGKRNSPSKQYITKQNLD